MRIVKYAFPMLFLVPLIALAQDPSPAVTPDAVPAPPETIEEAVGFIAALIKFFKSGQILLGLALVLNIFIFVIKNYAKWLKIPIEWKVPVITGLGLVVTVLARFIAGAEWSVEWVFAFLSGPVAIFIHQLISRFKGTPTG